MCMNAFCEEELFENPIEFNKKVNNQAPKFTCSLNEFCEKFIENIDVEKFIKQEIENDYVVVSLDECIRIAMLNNFDIAIKDKEFLSSKYEYQNALSKFLPILNTTSYIADYSGQILVGGVLRDTFHETAISVNITAEHELTKGGQQIFEAKAKKYFQRAQKHNLNFTKAETVYLTCKYYYEMLLAKINIEIYLRNLIERNAQLTYAINLEKSGFGTKFDVIRSENEVAQAKVNLLTALNEFRLSQTRVANLIGIDVETALMPFEDEINVLKLVDENVELVELFKSAKNFRQDLKAYEDIIAMEKQIKYSYVTEFVPRPMINYQEQFQGTLNHSVRPNYILAAYLSWQPGENLGVGTITKIKAQKEKINAKRLEYENAFRDIKEKIVASLSTTNFNKKQIDVTKDRLDYSKESINLAVMRFNNGKGILLDVIEAQGQMTEARVEYVRAIIKYNISQTELLFNSGIIDEETIIKNYHP